MNDDSKKPPFQGDALPFEADEDALPPLDDGAPEEDLGAQELLLDREDDGARDDEGAASLLTEEALRTFAAELCEFDDPKTDDREEGTAPCDLVSFEGDEWMGAGEDQPDLEDSWFEDDGDFEQPADDGGDEGPLAEEDVSLPDAPELEEGDFADEGGDSSAFERLDLPLSQMFGADDADGDSDIGDLEVTYFGPARGRVEDAAFLDDALFAAGDGLYRLGADSLLHRYDTEEDIFALSVATEGEEVFLGTEQRGLLRLCGFDGQIVPFNDWCATRPRTRAAGLELSVSFRVFASRREAGLRLIGLTGDGHLFASDDLGLHWRGPLLQYRCLAVTPLEGEDAAIALVARGNEAALLELDRDFEVSSLSLPCPIASLALSSPVSLAAAGSVIALSLDRPGSSLFVSLDRGKRFAEIPSVTNATALAVDPREPGWLAAAAYFRNEDLGVVRTSDDGGTTWHTAFTTGRAEDREELGGQRGRIRSLSVQGDAVRRLVAVAGDGVYTAVLAGRRASH